MTALRRAGAFAVCAALLAAQQPPGQTLADVAPQIDEVLARLAGGATDDRTFRQVRRLASASAAATGLDGDRIALLASLRRALPPDRTDDHAYVAQCQASAAARVGDARAVLGFARDAAQAEDAQVRERGLKTLFQAALYFGDIETAWPCLEQRRKMRSARSTTDAQQPATEDLDGIELLLRVGMVRAAAVELDRVERELGGHPRFPLLRLEELLVTEQFHDALLLADELLPQRAESDRDGRSRVRLSRAFALSRLGRAGEAESALRELLDDPEFDAAYRPRARADLALLRLRAGDPATAVAELLGSAASTPPSELGEWPLIARARLDLLRHRTGMLAPTTLTALRDALAERQDFQLRQWRATPALSAGVAFLQWSARRELLVCLCLAERAIDPASAADRCLAHALAADACGSLARLADLPVPTVAAFRKVGIPNGGVLLWFLPAPCGSLLLIEHAGATTAIELPSDAPMRNWMRDLRQAIVDERRLGADWAKPLAALVHPVSLWLEHADLREVLRRHRRVSILGRELLAGLPFEFLPDPTGQQRWFGHSHAIDYLPSAALAAVQPALHAPATGTGRLRLLAATELAAEVAARDPGLTVPLTEDALRAMAGAVHPAAIEIVMAASAEHLLAPGVDCICAVVFAHGQRRREHHAGNDGLAAHRPLGIVLRDGFFGVERLAGIDTAPPIVVLAACGTARAGVDRGEDSQLFGTAWLAAGAQHVLAAEGDLQLHATTLLVRAFLGELAAAVEPAEALRRARVAVAAVPGLAHPALHNALRLDRRALTSPALPAAPEVRGPWLLASILAGLGALGTALRAAARRRRQPPVSSPPSGGSSGGGGGTSGGSIVLPMPPS